MNKGHIFFISGVTGSGKGTAIKGLLDENIENLELALSCKTREPRSGEVIGVDYNKMSVEEFQEAIDNGEFLEYNFIHNQAYYGTRFLDVIDNGINKGKIIIKEMDILILSKVLEERKEYRDNFTYIFLDLSIEKIKERMIHRGDDVTGEDYLNRIKSAEKEQAMMHLADHVIDGSGTPNDTLKVIKKIISDKRNSL